MAYNWPIVGASVFALTGCGIPSVNTSTISQTSASPAKFALAQAAVNACSKRPDWDAEFAAFKRAGFPIKGRSVSSPDPDLILIHGGLTCTVGLKGMTPQQAYDLALPWVKRFDAVTNAQAGDGLSDHAVQAWRSYTADRRVNILAYKTWPFDGGEFPNEPGAAVRLRFDDFGKSDAPSYTYTLN